ncbi:hypothetical protein EVB87_088 [Rhizobium phage RHph_N28_1]|nr:hypothetical protein EVB87_088 [Rhizobium phage RHph_N28_1]QIG74116.1 hypothetical protein EVC07_088 [Rhizobium phage RHph_N42]
MDNLDPLRGLMDEAKTDFAAGTYAAVWLNANSAAALYKHYRQFVDSENLEAAKDFHITTTYSKMPVDIPLTKISPFTLNPDYFEHEAFGDLLVLRVKHKKLDELWSMACALGASWDYPTYKPHITISQKRLLIDRPPPVPDFPLVVSRYKVEPLND